MDALEMTLLLDYYGEMLTERQRIIFAMRHDQDLSLGEIGEALGVSRQAVCDNLTRSEALLRKMEENIGCVRRDAQRRRHLQKIKTAVDQLLQHSDTNVTDLARQILEQVRSIEE